MNNIFWWIMNFPVQSIHARTLRARKWSFFHFIYTGRKRCNRSTNNSFSQWKIPIFDGFGCILALCDPVPPHVNRNSLVIFQYLYHAGAIRYWSATPGSSRLPTLPLDLSSHLSFIAALPHFLLYKFSLITGAMRARNCSRWLSSPLIGPWWHHADVISNSARLANRSVGLIFFISFCSAARCDRVDQPRRPLFFSFFF